MKEIPKNFRYSSLKRYHHEVIEQFLGILTVKTTSKQKTFKSLTAVTAC